MSKNNVNAKNSILNAINNLIEANSKNNPYDKTFIGRITAIGSNNQYNVAINGKIYENIKGLPLFSFNLNDMVYCLAPQGNLNQLRIILGLGKPGLKIGDCEVDAIESISLTSNGYVKYKSGLIIQWGEQRWARTNSNVTKDVSLNIAFSTSNYSVTATLYESSENGYHITTTALFSKNETQFRLGCFVVNVSSYCSGFDWIAIGY